MRRVRHLWRALRRIPEALLVLIGLGTIPFLPRRAVLAMASVVGAGARLVNGRMRRLAMQNLIVAFGPELAPAEAGRILRDSYRTFALVMLDLFWFSRDCDRRLRRYVVFEESVRHYHAATPGIIVTGHLGNWEVVGQATGQIGQPIVSVARPLKNPWADVALGRMRRGTGQQTATRRGAVRVLLGALRKGGHIALLLDQNTLPHEGGLFVDFFGLPAPISLAPVTLARRSGAAIVVAMCRLGERGRYHVDCLPPLVVEGLSDAEALQRTAHGLEQFIRTHPGQWLWMYKRWKYIPDGAPVGRYPSYARPAPVHVPERTAVAVPPQVD